jgi:hypothetical protein
MVFVGLSVTSQLGSVRCWVIKGVFGWMDMEGWKGVATDSIVFGLESRGVR